MPIMEQTVESRTDYDLSTMFKALGDPTRLKIFDFLRAQCCPIAVEDSGDVRPVVGPTVGEICCSITGAEKITSSVSFHIKELRLARLVTVERRGKNMICSVNLDAVRALTEYLGDSSATDDQQGCCSATAVKVKLRE